MRKSARDPERLSAIASIARFCKAGQRPSPLSAANRCRMIFPGNNFFQSSLDGSKALSTCNLLLKDGFKDVCKYVFIKKVVFNLVALKNKQATRRRRRVLCH